MFKRTMKRFITLMMAMMMVISLIPASAFAASTEITGLSDSNIGLVADNDNNGKCNWNAFDTTINGSAEGTSSTCDGNKQGLPRLL